MLFKFITLVTPRWHVSKQTYVKLRKRGLTATRSKHFVQSQAGIKCLSKWSKPAVHRALSASDCDWKTGLQRTRLTHRHYNYSGLTGGRHTSMQMCRQLMHACNVTDEQSGFVRNVLSDQSQQTGQISTPCVQNLCRIDQIVSRLTEHLTSQILHKPSSIRLRVLQVFTSAELNAERSVFGDRSKWPTEQTHFRTPQRVQTDQTPPTFRPVFESSFQRSDRSDRTDRSFRTHHLLTD